MNGLTPAPSSESDRIKAETERPACSAAVSTDDISSSAKRMWATFSRLAARRERNAFGAFIGDLSCLCGRRPRIEGSSLDRLENVSHFSVSCQLKKTLI
ncbi:hypothetical protein EOA24_40945 [Mesorhizobium sp. M2A.F.Ca.ET.039.01.1.1]|nr:hypothetical protein EOA24_40945 [Mesorhizobium sp. M2A.F.Ca.ET.039.01.1.1]